MSMTGLQNLVEENRLDFIEVYCRINDESGEPIWQSLAEIDQGKKIYTIDKAADFIDALNRLYTSLLPIVTGSITTAVRVDQDTGAPTSIKLLVDFLEERFELGDSSWQLSFYYGPIDNTRGWIVTLTGAEFTELQLSMEGENLEVICISLHQLVADRF